MNVVDITLGSSMSLTDFFLGLVVVSITYERSAELANYVDGVFLEFRYFLIHEH